MVILSTESSYSRAGSFSEKTSRVSTAPSQRNAPSAVPGTSGKPNSPAKDNTKPINIFYIWYTELCRRQNTNPICAVRNPNQRNDQVLEFNADRIKIEDWQPIINAIRLDTSLHVISIHSKMPNQKFIEEADTEEKVKKIKKWFGAVCTKYILKNLVKGLGNCIKCSPVLSCLELDGLKIYGDYLGLILKCLESNKTVKYLSFKACPVEDEGCFDICNTLHALPNVEVLNLSGCALGTKSAESISKLIKFQQINRYCESWHSSLRYEDPLVNKMAGLRRITVNNNPKIGDEGLDFILNELTDDLWIKAIDMQRCGITEHIAGKIIDTVDYSRSLEVFDLRNNMLSTASLERILEILKNKQTEDCQGQYQWCFTSTTLDTQTYGSYVSLTNTKSSKYYDIKKSTVKQQSKTMPHLQHKPTPAPEPKAMMKEKILNNNKNNYHNNNNHSNNNNNHSNNNNNHSNNNNINNNKMKPEHAALLTKAEEQLVVLYKSLKEEQAKRREYEIKCEELQQQVDELLNQKKNQMILKEFTNMKQYIKKFINFVKDHGGDAEENEPIIQDLQNALDEVHILSKPYESTSQRLTSPETSEINLDKDDIPSTSDFRLNTLRFDSDDENVSNFFDTPTSESVVTDTDLKIKSLFQNLIGSGDDTPQDVPSIPMDSDDVENVKDESNTPRVYNSQSSETLKRLLEELSMEEADDWSTEEMSTVYSDSTIDTKDQRKFNIKAHN